MADIDGLLGDKGCDVERAAQLALAESQALGAVLDGVLAADDVYRCNSFRVAERLSRERPEALYPIWDQLAGMLDSANGFQRAIAVQLLAGLAGAEDGARFAALADRYFGLLDDKSVMVARYVAQSAVRVAQTAPGLRGLVRAKLLCVAGTHHEAGRKALVKADAIATLAELVEGPDEEVEAFVSAELHSSSPKARAAAKAFFAAGRR